MKILIVNAHSYYNLGDAAILMTMIERLSMVFRDAEFTVISDTPVEDSKFYKNIKISGIKYPFERKNRLLSAFRKLIFYVRFWICVFLNKKIKHFNGQIVLQKDAVEAIKHIGSTDMVISCGGGYLNSFGKLFARLSLILCAIYYKKPTVMYSQSVSDLSGFLDKKLTVFTINLLDKFICREKLTYDYLTKLGVRRDKLKIRADSAFLLRQASLSQIKEIASFVLYRRNVVGMTVTRWSFPGSKNPLFLKEEYIRSFRECASHITGRLGMQILVFPQVTGPSSYSDDRIFAKEIFGPLENQDIVLLNEHYEPDKLKGIMAHMTVFVGTRMHSNIFSLSAKVPTMAIAYQEKTTGIMEMLGLGDWVIPINDVSPKKMINMFSDLLHHRDFLKEKLIDVMPKIELSASAAADVCKKVYDMKM